MIPISDLNMHPCPVVLQRYQPLIVIAERSQFLPILRLRLDPAAAALGGFVYSTENSYFVIMSSHSQSAVLSDNPEYWSHVTLLTENILESNRRHEYCTIKGELGVAKIFLVNFFIDCGVQQKAG